MTCTPVIDWTVFDRKALIIQAMLDGARPAEVAARYNITSAYVHKVVREACHDIPTRPGPPKLENCRPLSDAHRRLGCRLSKWLFDEGVSSLEEAARRLGLARASVRRIEAGAVDLRLSDLLRIVALTGIEVTDLFKEVSCNSGQKK